MTAQDALGASHVVSLDVVRFCAIECELQMSGERSVAWMVNAWKRAERTTLPLVHDDIVALGMLVEPGKNAQGYRTVGVRVGDSIKPHHSEVPRLMGRLLEQAEAARDAGEQAEWYRQYEEIHPFRDGNGRTGQILYNLLCDTLHAPEWAPDFWNDWRREPGHGAPHPNASSNETAR